jgi:hypothetical protein
MEAICSSEILGHTYKTITWYYDPDDHNITARVRNLISQTALTVWSVIPLSEERKRLYLIPY